ncbi:hypothetical protein Taro_001134 [Colocasia esculenta]|uniref:Uncharacterized protein n=1 Tax=Colocasia esculenta TaxID=4460 RepID=A0A843TGY5_COLES|nr:hypothetical protein [Colocasia esculenta]
MRRLTRAPEEEEFVPNPRLLPQLMLCTTCAEDFPYERLKVVKMRSMFNDGTCVSSVKYT